MYVPSDVITIEKTGENFRLVYDVKGRFTVHRISSEEAKVCCRFVKTSMQGKGSRLLNISLSNFTLTQHTGECRYKRREM